MTTTAANMHVALRAVGTQGTAGAERGGAGGGGRAFHLTVQLAGQALPTQVGSPGPRLVTCIQSRTSQR